MRSTARRAIWALAAVLSATGCIVPHQAVVTDIDPMCWEHSVGLTIPNSDTLTLRDIEFFVRHNDRFSGDTLTVKITTFSPCALRHTEDLLLYLTPVATAAALTQQTLIPYRRHVCFSCSGNYRMVITPTRPVQGIEAFGVNLVKSNR